MPCMFISRIILPLLLCSMLLLPVQLSAQNPAGYEEISITGVIKPNYIRLLFAISDPSDVTIRYEGSLIVIDFGRPVSVQLDTLQQQLTDYIASTTLSNDQSRLFITLKNEEPDMRHFLGENVIGVDILLPREALGEPLLRGSRSFRIRLYDKPKMGTLTSDLLMPGQKPLAPEIIPETSPETEAEAMRAYISRDQLSPLEQGEIWVYVEDQPTQVTLTFPWDISAASAVFHQGDFLWIIFDQPTNLRLESLRKTDKIRGARQFEHDFFTVLRLAIDPQYSFTGEAGKMPLIARMFRRNLTWQLNLAKTSPEIVEQYPYIKRLSIFTERTESGPQVFINANRPGNLLKLKDSEMGGSLLIVPIFQSEHGIFPEREFVDLALPQTVQGIVVRPYSDDLLHKLSYNGVSLFSSRTLNLSEELITESEDERRAALLEQVEFIAKDQLPQESIFPFESYGIFEDVQENFLEERQAHYQEYAEMARSASEDELIEKQLDIARFFFNRLLFPEAIGALRDITNRDPLFASREVNLMMAVSQYMLGHWKDAEKLFTDEMIRMGSSLSVNELRLWQWASRYQRSKVDKASRQEKLPIDFIAAYDRFMQSYPNEVRFGLGLLAVSERLENEDTEKANNIMEIISYDEIPDEYRNDTDFFFGKIAQQLGQEDRAREFWLPLTRNLGDRQNRARAQFELTTMDLKNEAITTEEAINRLDRLLAVWRGDQLEVDILKLIGELYIDENRFSEGLKAWETLATNFSGTKEALLIAGRMKQTFIDLFDHGDAYHLPPFDALSLYFEFRELTPVGAVGDRIVQQLATHFINADLLDNAIAILTHQLRFRNVEDKRNELAIRLANLQLLNRRPENVPDAISYMDFTSASPEELKLSKYIRARALVDQKRYKETYNLLANDFSPEAQDIRLDIFWELGNWFGIMNIIEPRLWQFRETAPLPLTDEEIEQIRRLAVAYAAQERYDQLASLRNDFANRFEEGDERRHIFDFLTHSHTPVRPSALSDTVQLETLERFVNDYAFWPSQQWAYAIDVIEPEILSFDAETANTLSPELEKDVVRLAIAYIERLEELEGTESKAEQTEYKELERKLKEHLRRFKDVTINSTNLEVFKTYDPPLALEEKYEDGVVFTGTVPLAETADFIDIYQNVETISELNEIVQ